MFRTCLKIVYDVADTTASDERPAMVPSINFDTRPDTDKGGMCSTWLYADVKLCEM